MTKLVGLLALSAVGIVTALPAVAGVLPEDRADALYHRYDGGGVTIQGPSLLVRKKLKEKFSFTANYYVDMVSSASIDVQTSGASEYKEERKQYSLGMDYLRGKSTYSMGFSNSKENDYEADTAYLTLSQDMFGDLTTVSLGFTRGWDKVLRNDGGIATFMGDTDRRQYRVGVSQIVTRNLLLDAAYEVVTDEGFLNNPYRSVRFVDGAGFLLQRERYPRTRTSNAVAVGGRYYLPYRAALNANFRFFGDTWGIRASTAEVGYTHPWGAKWIFDGSYRFYTQDRADFFSDLFPRANAQNFLARDKELSTFTSQTIGVGATYELPGGRPRFVQKSTLNLRYDYMMFNYDDFRDARGTGIVPGTEPLYSFNANVIQFFVSVWF
jgi:hypothetical protein